MNFSRERKLAGLTLLAILSFPSCLAHKRVVMQPGAKQNQPLLNATKEQLIQLIRNIYDPIQSFSAKVTMGPSVGSLYGGEVTDYPSINGFILFEKPDQIRVIGLDPVIHSTAFDMVSHGNEFDVSIPIKNLFIEGNNNAPATSKNKLENLRPTAFLNSLIIDPPDPQKDFSVVEDDTDETKSVYILMLLEKGADDSLKLKRNIYFDRRALRIWRQKSFDPAGGIIGQTIYSDWKTFGTTVFPTTIIIQRPQDGYEVDLSVTDLKLNAPELTSGKFSLTAPPNAQIREIK